MESCTFLFEGVKVPTSKDKAKHTKFHQEWKKRIFLASIVLPMIFGLAKSIEFTKKDLSSDETLWNLYERWRSHHTVKEKGSFQRSWAFSTVVGVEGINKIKTGKLMSLSEQELVDCGKYNKGCNGGLVENAYEFIKKEGGITTETLYPYKARDVNCDSAKVVY
ncbi:cysteine protease [Striga asiatica]|uniref:Cysteine protease n=1 Tax=Striga asiatica TaxID=4170 RepID=A0A5A7RG65_STRAF|nr:cysteine protease [Striga asiatica]